ncbi:hypothetical protein GX48_08217 [Paracoccidioides brasiliensis]|nr:hypothetical protein GX48_08217 [Paracoccidioides brasiliensis]
MLEFAIVIRGMKMDVYLTANASKVMSEVDKVLMVSTYLSEAVFDWFKPRVRE